jgi:hypothetical protein
MFIAESVLFFDVQLQIFAMYSGFYLLANLAEIFEECHS